MNKLLTAVGASLITAALVLFGGVAPANAATTPGTVKSVSFNKTEATLNEQVRATFELAVPDTATAGDTFTITLPNELVPMGARDFPITTPDNGVLGNATWSGSTVITTFTPYVDQHENITASMFFATTWAPGTPNTAASFELSFTTDGGAAVTAPLNYRPYSTGESTWGDTRPADKAGVWANPITEGNDNPVGALKWTVALPGKPEGYLDGINVRDKALTGWVFNCDLPAIATRITVDGLEELPDDRYTITCSPEEIFIQVATVLPVEFINFTYATNVTDASLLRYENIAHFDYIGIGIQERTAYVTRALSGGDGDGDGDLYGFSGFVFIDTNKDGVKQDDEQLYQEPVVTTSIASDQSTPLASVLGVFQQVGLPDDALTFLIEVHSAVPAGYSPTTPTTLPAFPTDANGVPLNNQILKFGITPDDVVPPVTPPATEPPVTTPPVAPPVTDTPPTATPVGPRVNTGGEATQVPAGWFVLAFVLTAAGIVLIRSGRAAHV